MCPGGGLRLGLRGEVNDPVMTVGASAVLHSIRGAVVVYLAISAARLH